MSEEAEDSEAIIEVHEHGAVGRDAFAAVQRHAGGPDEPGPAVDVRDDRRLPETRRCPDVQVQAVFARDLGPGVLVRHHPARGLDALRRETVSVPYTRPVRLGLRLPPSQITNGRRRVRYAEVGANARRQLDAIQPAGVEPDRRRDVGGERNVGQRRQREARNARQDLQPRRYAHFESPLSRDQLKL